MNLDKIYNQVQIKTRMRVERTLLVSSGRGEISPGGVDIPQIQMTIREGDRTREEPYIPGSSVKGPIRSVCEAIVRTFIPDYKTSNILCYDNAPEEETDCGKGDRAMCMICDTFGNTNRASKVALDDAFLTEDSLKLMGGNFTQQRAGISIDRKKGTVHRGPFFIEYIPKGAEFEFNILCTNILPAELKLLLLAMRLFNDGRFKMGGQRSRGMGSISFEVDSVTTYLPKLYRFEPLVQKEDRTWRWIKPDELADQILEKFPDKELEKDLEKATLVVYEVPEGDWKDVSCDEGKEAIKELASRLYPLVEGEGQFTIAIQPRGKPEMRVKVNTFELHLAGDLTKAKIEENINRLEYKITSKEVGTGLFDKVYASAFDFLGEIKSESEASEELRLPGRARLPLAYRVTDEEGKVRLVRVVMDVEEDSKPVHDLLIWLKWAEMLIAPGGEEK